MSVHKYVWGIYAIQGALIAVKINQAGEHGLEIDAAFLETNDGRTLPLHVASTLLARVEFRGRPAVVALPDAGGFLATVRVPAAEATRSGPELLKTLYDATPFDAGHAELRHALVAREADDEIHLVAAVKRSAVAAALHELEHKPPHPGVAFGGAATIRGAKALGLCPERCVLVEIEPHVTVAYLLDHAHVRRRIIPFGEREVVRDAAHCRTLAAELRQLAADRPDSAATDTPARPAPFVLVGPAAVSPLLRQRLAEELGDRLAGGRIADGRVRPAAAGRLHQLPLAALAGAVGAALEAFASPHQCLLFHPVPDDLSTHVEPGPRPWVVAVACTVAAAFVYVTLQSLGPKGLVPADMPGAAAAAGPLTARPPAEPDAGRGASAGRSDRPVAFGVEPIGPGRVRVTWPAGQEDRVLRRFGTEWTDVATVGSVAGGMEDEVPGATQRYGWRIDDGETVHARVEVPVAVVFAGPAPGGGARFRLRRTWRGADCSVTVDVAVGEPIRARALRGDPPTEVTFDAGCSLVGVRVKTERETVTARLPQFLPDGRVERGADGEPGLDERAVERDRQVLEAQATTGDGRVLAWTQRGGG